jgi:nucleoside-diphosphate-sugar epimerase
MTEEQFQTSSVKHCVKFAKLIKKLCESDSEIIYKELPQDDPMQRKPDISKAKKILKWKPKVGLEEGLKTTIEYFRETK